MPGENNGFVLNLMTDGFPPLPFWSMCWSVTDLDKCDNRNVKVNAQGNQVISCLSALTRSVIGATH